MAKKVPKAKAAKKAKMAQVLGEFKQGTLKSGSKQGPPVRSRAQAIAIGLKQSGQSKAGKKRARSKPKTSVEEALSK